MQGTLSLDEAAERAWDAIVIGAGPAGSVCAAELAGSGHVVLLVESRPFPRSKVCGGCLNQNSLASLASAGLLDAVNGLKPIPLDRFRLASGGRQVTLALPGGCAVSRTAMDEVLARGAVGRGAAFLPETTAVVGDVRGDVRNVTLDSRGCSRAASARIVIAASGLGGRALSGMGELRSTEAPRSRIGVEALLAEFPDAYEPGVIFMAVGRRGYVGLTRVEDGRLNVAAAVDAAALRDGGGAAQACMAILNEAGFPIAPEMARADWHGTIKLTRRSSRRAAERLFLIGDAAGYIEPFTGEGMSWAFASALGVAPIVREGIRGWTSQLPDAWEREYRAIIEQRQWVCRALAAGLRRTALVRAAVPVLTAMPWLARPVIRHLNHQRSGVIT